MGKMLGVDDHPFILGHLKGLFSGAIYGEFQEGRVFFILLPTWTPTTHGKMEGFSSPQYMSHKPQQMKVLGSPGIYHESKHSSKLT